MSYIKEANHLRIPLQDISLATNGFDNQNLIATGGSGKTYKGISEKHGDIAVKRLDRTLHRGRGNHELIAEIALLLSEYKQENIVPFLGFCDEDGEMILVYKYESNKSLDLHISSTDLTWIQRLQISLDAARGLRYLHDDAGSQHRVLHRDIKSSNILLDGNLKAKICNFGLSKLGFSDMESTFLITNACGTIGYLDPEYLNTGILTTKSDVYSFGVVLFELLCGRLTCIESYKDERRFLTVLAQKHYIRQTLDRIIPSYLHDQMNTDSLHMFSKIAYQCLKNREERPTMEQVVEQLQEALHYQLKDIPPLSTGLPHLHIPLQEILSATNGFANENLIANGGFGDVYKGMSETYGHMAIKRLGRRQGKGYHGFKTEIDLLSAYDHENIVSLLGFCNEDGEKILVYKYESNGSLEKHLNNVDLTWIQRLKICLDVAHGLKYIHADVAPQHRIIHRNVKSSNVLLDENLNAKICDFGLSIASAANMQSAFLIENVCGTPGYIDPEYRDSGFLTEKSDVYSFGVVLFEVLCGRLARVTSYNDERQYLSILVKKLYRMQRLDTIIHSSLQRQINTLSLRTFLNVAFQCLKNLEERPTMKQVVEQLEKALQNQLIHAKSVSIEVKNLQIPLQEISLATNEFANNNSFAHGGFGKVYKGISQTYGHIAIKRLDRRQGQGDDEFKMEIALLSKYKHKNIITLLGFCDEGGEKILVYKYESNGSLDRHLNNQDLTWIQRLQICLDAACGLKYLHDDVGSQHRIIHRDVKSGNILLDEKWNAKISDFGLSRVGPANMKNTYLISRACGTTGYIDPDYLITGYLTAKSDVYSFGAVLMEVLCGRGALVTSYKDDRRCLTNLAQKHYIRKTLDRIIPSYLYKQMNIDSLLTFSDIAYQCLKNREERPTMKQVVEQLQKALDQQLPSGCSSHQDLSIELGIKSTTLVEELQKKITIVDSQAPNAQKPEPSEDIAR